MVDDFNFNNCFTCNDFISLFEDRFYIAQDTVNNKSYYLCPRCYNIASNRWDFYNPVGLTTGEVYNYVISVIANNYQRHKMNQMGKDQNVLLLENTIGQLQVKLASYQSQLKNHLTDPEELLNQLSDIKIILNGTKDNLSNEISKLENALYLTGVTSKISANLKKTFDQIHNIMLSTEMEVEHLLAEAQTLCHQARIDEYGYMTTYEDPYNKNKYTTYNSNHHFSK